MDFLIWLLWRDVSNFPSCLVKLNRSSSEVSHARDSLLRTDCNRSFICAENANFVIITENFSSARSWFKPDLVFLTHWFRFLFKLLQSAASEEAPSQNHGKTRHKYDEKRNDAFLVCPTFCVVTWSDCPHFRLRRGLETLFGVFCSTFSESCIWEEAAFLLLTGQSAHFW